jgi:hypothetical protein
MFGMISRKNHSSGLKRWNGKFSTMFENHHYLPLHDHFGEFPVEFAHSTKS